MKTLEKMSFSQNAQQIISYTFYILFAGYSIYKIIQAEFISTKTLFIILLIIILGIALYSEYLKHLYRKAIKTIAYDLNPEKANKQFNELLKKELYNSLKYKYLSMFILYEDFISMLLKEYNIYKIGITIDSAIKLLKDKNVLTDKFANYLNSARLLRNRIGHRYKQPKIEVLIEFLEENNDIKKEFLLFIKGFMS